MGAFDYVVYAVLAVLVIWAVSRIIVTIGKIRLQGKVPGRIAASVIVIALLGYAVWSRPDTFHNVWVVGGGILLGMGLYALIRAGFGDDGLYVNGSLVPFKTMNFYTLEPRTAKKVILRVHTAKRDYALLFTNAQQEEVERRMEEGGVSTLEQHQKKQPRNF